MMTKGFFGGLACGALIGAAIGMLADPMTDKQHKKLKSSANHMFKTVGTVIDSVMENM